MKREIEQILEMVKRGEIETSNALKLLEGAPFSDLGYAKVDHHRGFRQGMHEVIFCEGKTIEQISEIATKMYNSGSDILCTRADIHVYSGLKEIFPKISYNKIAKVVTLKLKEFKKVDGEALILTAGTSDLPVAEEAKETLTHFGCNVKAIYDVGVAGVHRLMPFLDETCKADVIIVVAGMEGALPSLVGGLVACPVIAVPTSVGYGSSFEGLSALLGMLNSCASGIGVVNIDNGFGAACLAYRILSNRVKTEDDSLKKELKKRKSQES